MSLSRAEIRPSQSVAAPGAPVVVWAVRRDWPAGDHEFVEPGVDRAAAERALASNRRYWRRGPLRPALSLVRISRHDLELHGRARRGCRAPDCPAADPAVP